MNYIDKIAVQIRDAIDSDNLPDAPNATLLFRLYALLALSKGIDASARDVHDAWALWMTTVDPEHESIKPYGELDSATRREDEPFVEAIRKIAGSR